MKGAIRILGHALSQALAWTALPIFVLGSGYSLWLGYRIGQAVTIDGFILTLGFGSFAAVGSLLVARRPSNPVSWIVVTIGMVGGVFPTADAYTAYIMTTRGSPNLLAIICAWLNEIYWMPMLAMAMIFLPLLFPDGHLPSRRWLPVAILASLSMIGVLAINAFTETLTGQIINYQIANPIGIKGLAPSVDNPLFPYLVLGILLSLSGAVTSVIVRFRHSRGAERQQLKWFLGAGALIPLMVTTAFLPNVLGAFIVGFIFVCLSTAIGIAVLRYRLYDIDILIRRTLQYSLLTGLLALVYFGGIVLLQSIFRALTGEASQFAIVISTLGIAALFSPLRLRVQEFIDRRFYRRKYDAERSLAQFAVIARDEVDLQALAASLLGVVQETMQPDKASLWIRKSNE